MAASPSFISTPNNTMIRIDSGDSFETLDWQAGANGGRLRQILVRAVADQEVVVSFSLRIGAAIYPFLRVVPPIIAVADDTVSTQPPIDLLSGVYFPGAASTPENQGFDFAEGDGVRMSIVTSLDPGELVTIAMLGADY